MTPLKYFGKKRSREQRRSDPYYRHQADYDMNILLDINLIELHYYLEEVDGHALTIYTDFIVELVEKMISNRQFGFIRVFIETGDKMPISVLIRCFNAYINGLHDGVTLYEIGLTDKEHRYFKESELTGYMENYPDLLGHGHLFGLRLGPKQFRKDVRRVEENRGDPRRWKEPIARFAFTFSESGRFIWIREDLGDAFDSGEDIVIESGGRHGYMARLPRRWSEICEAAREEIENDTKFEDPPVMSEYLKRTKEGCDRLETNSDYAKAALGFRNMKFRGAQIQRTTGDIRVRGTRSSRTPSNERSPREERLKNKNSINDKYDKSKYSLSTSHLLTGTQAQKRTRVRVPEKGYKGNEINQEAVKLRKASPRVERQTPSHSFDSGSEESDYKKKRQRLKWKHDKSDDDDSYDSRIEDSKEAKRRRKEKRKLKKEEKRIRREERNLKKEAKRRRTEESGSEESDYKKKRQRLKRKHDTSDDDDSYDSHIEDRKEAKRRRKEERKLKKEEAKRRRKEKRKLRRRETAYTRKK
ncbi:serine/arginine repetitive matrix protein 1 isoform X1 [Tanacetum coccineum]